MQRFSAQIPWVVLEQDVHSGQHEQWFHVACQVCGARADVPFRDVGRWAEAHRLHQAPRGSLRLGDAVAAVAKPIARAVGMDPNCSPCEARRRMLNQIGRRG